jgi:hypothetical protein
MTDPIPNPEVRIPGRHLPNANDARALALWMKLNLGQAAETSGFHKYAPFLADYVAALWTYADELEQAQNAMVEAARRELDEELGR